MKDIKAINDKLNSQGQKKTLENPKIRADRKGEKGLVLILVLIIIAILTILVADFTFSTHVDLEISKNSLNEIKAQYIAKSGINVISSTMKTNSLEELGDLATLVVDLEVGEAEEELWSFTVPSFPVGDGVVSLKVEDERSKINLNSLVNTSTNKVDFQVFTALTQLFRFLEVDQAKSTLFIASLVNWLDREIAGAQNDQDPEGAKRSFYNGLENPYEIKDGQLDSIEEIRMIEGMDEDFYNKVKDYVTVFPQNKFVSFSTASKPVMMAVIKAAQVSSNESQSGNQSELKDSTAEVIADEILEKRKEESLITGIEARNTVRDIDSTLNISAGLSGLVLSSGKSDTFLVKSTGVVGEVSPTLKDIEAVLRRSTGTGNTVQVVSWKEK
ncbi:MAG: general secretion pathway protein GspK [Thermodesulfobacteriota bacterium]